MLRLLLIASLFVSAFGGLVPSPKRAYDAGRIIGGTIVSNIEDFPYTAEVYSDLSTCGGAILSENVILSAASCMGNGFLEDWRVHVGTVVSQSGGQTVKVRRIIFHSQFSITTDDYDIALVYVNYPLVLDNITVKAITLPKQDEPIPVAARGSVAGWGATTSTGIGYSSVLRNITVMVIDQALCIEAFYNYNWLVSERMVCASYSKKGNDVSSGDRGSPLVVDGVAVGITSWGTDYFARLACPGVWTRVSPFVDWINERLNE